MSKIKLYNEDCLPAMRKMRDNEYDLCICDPPYGINVANDNRFGKKNNKSATYTNNYEKKDWDNEIPSKKYFDELFRVSKNQIIWGVNYFDDKRLCGGRIFWNKEIPQNYTKSKGEIAFKSFGKSVDYVRIIWHGMIQEDMKNKQKRIHPTEKPVALYKWLLKNYAKHGDKILNTHFGSLSIGIACYDMGFDLTAYEIDKDYFEAGKKRLENHKLQYKIPF